MVITQGSSPTKRSSIPLGTANLILFTRL